MAPFIKLAENVAAALDPEIAIETTLSEAFGSNGTYAIRSLRSVAGAQLQLRIGRWVLTLHGAIEPDADEFARVARAMLEVLGATK